MNQPSARDNDTRPSKFSDKPGPGNGSVLYILKKPEEKPDPKATAGDTTPDPNADPQVEIKKFAGEWQKVENDKFTLIIAGNKMTFFYNGNKNAEGLITIDPKVAPKHFTLKWTLSGAGGKTSFGIYRFTEDGNLEICMNQPSARESDTRPTKFSDKPGVGSGSILYILKRVEGK